MLMVNKREKDKEIENLIEEVDHLYACLNRQKEALKKIEHVLRLDPGNTEAIVFKGKILFALDRSVQESMTCFDQAITLDPKCGEAYLQRARMHYVIYKDCKKAFREIKKALSFAAEDQWLEVESLLLKGNILSELDQEDKALASYHAALKLRPEDEDVQWSLGSTLLGMGNPSKALPYLQASLEGIKKNKYVDQCTLDLRYSDLAEAFNALGRHEKALMIIREGLKVLKGTYRECLVDLQEKILSMGHLQMEKSDNLALSKRLKSRNALERADAFSSLSKSDHPMVVFEMIKGLSDSNPIVRKTVAECLGEMNKKEAIKPLIDKLDDHFPDVRREAVKSLHILLKDRKSCPPKLFMSLHDPDELVCIEVIEIIEEIGDKKALTVLWSAISNHSGLVRCYVARAIGCLGDKKDIRRLEKNLQNEKSPTAKLGFYEGLYLLGQKEVLLNILKSLESKIYTVRIGAANILSGTIADQSNAPMILDALHKALKKETTVAADFALKSSIREITKRFYKGVIIKGS